ncbi:MAG TPA: hypothetical protein VF384_03710 [Planctomycetota bacterium]
MVTPSGRLSSWWFGNGRLRPRTTLHRTVSPLASLPSPEQTLGLIRRQEALRDRGRPPFSVVVVDVGSPAESAHKALRLLMVFRRRARVGDEAGWLTADRIALILPLTGRDGAQRFAEEVCNQAAGHQGPPRFEVYTA